MRDTVVIAAQSGRALAQAARRAGLRALVLDLFGDEDTLELAYAHRVLPGRFGAAQGGASSVMAAIDSLAAVAGARMLGVILGSGFEDSPELMARVSARYRLIGAGPGSVAALKEPLLLAKLCERLSIPHPVVTTGKVAHRDGWLLKRRGGSGGSHIRAATAEAAPPDHYFQRRVAGHACALNFLADGHTIAVVASTEQWSYASPARPFRYAGAIERGRDDAPVLSKPLEIEVVAAVQRIVDATALRGLASADLLIDSEHWWLLEINPRAGATLDVLDRRPTPLLEQHIEASLGRLPVLDPAPVDAAGSEICYATRRFSSVPPLDWPSYARDRPRTGTPVARDAPFCTVTAAGPDGATVRRSLRDRAGDIHARLEGREDTHGHRHHTAERQRARRSADRAPGG